MSTQQKTGFVVLTVSLKKEDKYWEAYCEELGTASFGKSFEDAQENIHEAIELHLNTLCEVGECERFLKERNISIIWDKPPEKIPYNITLDPNLFVSKNYQQVPCTAAF